MNTTAVDLPLRRPVNRSTAVSTVIVALLLTVILTQRLAVPLGGAQIPLALPLVQVIIIGGLMAGALVVHPVGVRLLSAALLCVCLSTLAVLLLGGEPSILSLIYLMTLYVLGCLRPSAALASSADPVHRVFLGLMSIAAAASLMQLAIQFLGVPHRDWLAAVLPADVLLQGYNTGDPVAYGSSLYRSNAVLFLEPSFLSLFLGAAVVLAVGRRAPIWQITLLVTGIVPTLAGNGIVVAVIGLLVLTISQRRGNVVRLVPALVIGVTLAAVTPLADLYLARTTEVSAQDTSSSLRLVQPYELLLPDWASDAAAVVFGQGAGTASDFIDEAGIQGLLAPVIPKALYEYGFLGAVPLFVFLGWMLVRGIPGRPWAPGLILAYLVINAALLQTTLAIGTILLVTFLPPLPAVSPRQGIARPDQRRPARPLLEEGSGRHRSQE